MLNHISPGIIGMYWLLASVAVAALCSLTARAAKRTAHRAGARCHCGTCQR